MATHREKLQAAIQCLQDVYDEAGYLRDHSTEPMQIEYNKVREFLPYIWRSLQMIDNKLIPDSLAEEEL